ncbi:DUF5999 family protein, partial [Streptomyces anulatus]
SAEPDHSPRPHFSASSTLRPTHPGEVQRRSLLCNGVLVFEDTGELLPDGRIVAPHRPLALTFGSAA